MGELENFEEANFQNDGSSVLSYMWITKRFVDAFKGDPRDSIYAGNGKFKLFFNLFLNQHVFSYSLFES